MILAVHAMSADAQVICYGIAVVAFVLAAVSGLTGRWNPSGMALVGSGSGGVRLPDVLEHARYFLTGLSCAGPSHAGGRRCSRRLRLPPGSRGVVGATGPVAARPGG